MMFGYRFLSTFKLFMPTMSMNRGDDEDSEYEEEIYISQKDVLSVANSRRVLDNKSVVTIDLLGVDDCEFLGIRVSQFLKKNLTEVGYFLFVNTKKWEMSEEDKKTYGPQKLQNRRSKKEALLSYYWLEKILKNGGFDFLFSNTKFKGDSQIFWEVSNLGDDSKPELVSEDILESYISPNSNLIDDIKK
jgi:hypothetical protein